jgi:hypothetical protein
MDEGAAPVEVSELWPRPPPADISCGLVMTSLRLTFRKCGLQITALTITDSPRALRAKCELRELNVVLNRELFSQELRRLIDRNIGPSGQFKDYVEIMQEMDCEHDRLGADGDKAGGISPVDEVER